MQKLISPIELAAITGLAVQTIYNRHSIGGPLPRCIKLGSRLRFDMGDVERWLEECIEQDNPGMDTDDCAETLPVRPGRPSKRLQVTQRKLGAR